VKLSFHLIPDGISTIVKFQLEGEFVVATADAEREAEAGIVDLVARFSGRPAEEIRAEMECERWSGEGWRPTEPDWPTTD
jgi:hypothetical protein